MSTYDDQQNRGIGSMERDPSTGSESRIEDMQRQSEQVIEEIQRRSEQVLTKAEELPDSFYLSTILGSMALSALLLVLGRRDLAIFVGLWPPSLLGLARLVKQRRESREPGSI